MMSTLLTMLSRSAPVRGIPGQRNSTGDQVTLKNNNGTVTRGWDQVRANRASSYPDAKNVKIDARDVKVQMLGAGGAVVTCLWRQSQEFRGAPDSSGRYSSW